MYLFLNLNHATATKITYSLRQCMHIKIPNCSLTFNIWMENSVIWGHQALNYSAGLFLVVDIFICNFPWQLFIYFWLLSCGILIPRQDIEPSPSAVRAQNLNHLTTGNSLLWQFENIIKKRVYLFWVCRGWGWRGSQSLMLDLMWLWYVLWNIKLNDITIIEVKMDSTSLAYILYQAHC